MSNCFVAIYVWIFICNGLIFNDFVFEIRKSFMVNFRTCLSVWPSILLLTCSVLMSGCNESSNETSAKPTDKSASAQISVSGGEVAIQSADSPIYGAKVVVADDTLVTPETFTLSYQDELPSALNDESLALGAKQASKVLIFERTGSVDFGLPVNITIPFDKTVVPENSAPIVVYWDESTASYSPVAIRSIDWTHGTITFMTAHASKYVVLILDKIAGVDSPEHSQLSFNVGFDPAVDSFFVHNFGTYDSPGGNCFGMAAYAAWYQNAKKSVKGEGLRTLYKEGDINKEEDDQIARELIARVFQAGDQKAHIEALKAAAELGFDRELQERFIALSIIQQLVVTKQAQILAMGISADTENRFVDGHAVTVYAYDGDKKEFLYYDNNYPGEVVSVPWDWNNGFGLNTKNKQYDDYAFASFNSAYSSATLENLFDAAESGFDVSHYPKITITNLTESSSSSNIYEISSSDSFKIAGYVPRPTDADNKNQPRYVHVYLNGVHDSTAYAIDQATNTFEIPVSRLSDPTGTDVMLLVSEDARSWGGGFHAFKQFKIRVAEQAFFNNLGFETGDFTGWASERHAWFDSNSITPSDKSEVISGSGTDPIATDLPVPLFGRHVARINNNDGDYHISTISQTAIVPSAKNPTVKFYWAAVLEDPQHDPSEQPYVDITVEDQTKAVTLYKKRFYANDPNYSGWQSYQDGQWKAIPWQLVEIPLSNNIGDTILLKVEAADCAQGGHGGYAYLDVEE